MRRTPEGEREIKVELEVSSDFKKEEKIGRLMERGLFSALERERRGRMCACG